MKRNKFSCRSNVEQNQILYYAIFRQNAERSNQHSAKNRERKEHEARAGTRANEGEEKNLTSTMNHEEKGTQREHNKASSDKHDKLPLGRNAKREGMLLRE
ncbi:hypothetical protein Ahy_B01g052953 isoform C [Arachis hypogaea]|uniref:Uncharacterized protein n=1 Tax=Arachis hypogaea TaxID=3818 RepID=A0A445AQX0_ARAHY|nr:hypothetical protein Ahy_B01g052953 isoform C [Arachis hypogaea]